VYPHVNRSRQVVANSLTVHTREWLHVCTYAMIILTSISDKQLLTFTNIRHTLLHLLKIWLPWLLKCETANTHTHPFNGPLSVTTRVSRYQKGKPIWILLMQETVIGSGISWAICKSAHRCKQTTTPAPHHSVFYRPDALPVAQPTPSKN